MSWLPCRCGYIFHDNTDFLSFKAHFRADQDTDDFFCQVEDILKNGCLFHHLIKSVILTKFAMQKVQIKGIFLREFLDDSFFNF